MISSNKETHASICLLCVTKDQTPKPKIHYRNIQVAGRLPLNGRPAKREKHKYFLIAIWPRCCN